MKKLLLSLVMLGVFLANIIPLGGGNLFAANTVGSTITVGKLTATITKVATASTNGEMTLGATSGETISGELPLNKIFSQTLNGIKYSYDCVGVTANGFLNQTEITSVVWGTLARTINANAFQGCTGLTTINIPAATTTIGDNAFSGCTNLESVTGGANVTTIGNSAFKNCEKLTRLGGSAGIITIPASVTTMGTQVFYGCKAINKITWSATNCNDFTSSSNSPFYNSNSSNRAQITTFTISSSVQHIPAYLCYGMTGITGSKSFNSSLRSIGAYAFYGCTGLTGLSFTSATNLTSIGSNAFYNCNAVTSSIKLPASLTMLGTCAFQTCKSLAGLTFADDCQLTEIPNNAFQNCYKLAGTITLPPSVTSIGNYAFQNCTTAVAVNLIHATNLTTIGTYAFAGMSACTGLLYIPSKVTSIGTYAFNNMTALEGIVAMPTTPPTAGSAYTFNNVVKNIPVYVKDETTKNKYIADACTGWKEFTNYKYETDPQQCGDNLYWQFRFSTNRVVFTGSGDMWNYDNSSNKAPWRVYNDCLKYVDFCADMTSIGDYAFYQCTNYIPGNFTIKANIKSVGQYAFYQCTGITSLGFTDGSNLRTIGQRAFQGCSGIKKITLPEGIETVPSYCFYNCSKIESLSIPNGLTAINERAFYGCSALKSINLPSSVTSIGTYAFSGCSAVEYIKSDNTTPPTATAYSFNSVPTSTALLCVPEGSNESYCSATGWSAFCENIGQEIGGECGTNANWKLNLATGTLTIYGSGAMTNSYTPWANFKSDIAKIVIEEGITTVGESCFSGYTSVKSISLPSTITAINKSAFANCTAVDTMWINFDLSSTVSLPTTQQGYSSYANLQFQNIPSDAVVVIPLGSYSNFSAKTVWKDFTYHYIGYCGAEEGQLNVTWDLTLNTGLMSFRGTGAMKNYGNESTPWYSFRESIISADFSEGITSTSGWCFNDCSKLTAISLPSTLTTIGVRTFGGTAIESISIPNDVTSLGNNAFYQCDKLENIVLSSSLNSIGSNVFDGCISLTSITIPNSVTSIGANAFNGCTSLVSVTSEATTSPTVASNTFSGITSSATLVVPGASKADYVAADYWKDFYRILPYVVQFELNGHGIAVIEDQYVGYGGRLETAPADPAETGYTFGGWYSDEACTTPFTFGEAGTVVDADLTLYAKWTENIFTFADTDTDNSKIAAADGKSATSVTIERTIWKDGYYNSMCLPFSLSAAELDASPLAGYKALKRLSSATVTGTGDERVLNIQLEPITAITAGEPFFISYEAGENIVNPVFADVTVTAVTPGSITAGDVTCQGIYARTYLDAVSTNLFLGANNTLYWPETAGYMNGLRAYFSVSTSGPAYAGMRARLIDKPAETPTGMETVAGDNMTMRGRKFILNGHLFIECDGKTYSAQGVLVQ